MTAKPKTRLQNHKLFRKPSNTAVKLQTLGGKKNPASATVKLKTLQQNVKLYGKTENTTANKPKAQQRNQKL